MKFLPTPTIKIIEPNSLLEDFGFFLDTRCDANKTPKASLLFIKNLQTCSELSMVFEGFDYLDSNPNGKKYLNGKVFIRQIYEKQPVMTLIANPRYSVDLNTAVQSEVALVRELKAAITKTWITTFNDALEANSKSIQPITTSTKTSSKHHPSRSQQITTPIGKFCKRKYFGYVVLGATIILFNGFMWSKSTSHISKQNQPYALANAEQMAIEQDQILNNAFKEIGIDREKLASDMSCFTE